MALGSNGGYSSKDKDRTMVNVQVSRRANIKNNFYPADKRGTPQFQSFGMTQVCVQFSLEKASFKEINDGAPVDVVFVSMVLLNDLYCEDDGDDSYVRDKNEKLNLRLERVSKWRSMNFNTSFSETHPLSRCGVGAHRSVLNPPMREPHKTKPCRVV